MDYFGDFETGIRKELALDVKRLVETRAADLGIDVDAGMMTSAQAVMLATAVQVDTVMFALRRYHEWTESQPR